MEGDFGTHILLERIQSIEDLCLAELVAAAVFDHLGWDSSHVPQQAQRLANMAAEILWLGRTGRPAKREAGDI